MRAAPEQRQARADIERAHLDDVTDAFTRGFGLAEMQHQIERARRVEEIRQALLATDPPPRQHHNFVSVGA